MGSNKSSTGPQMYWEGQESWEGLADSLQRERGDSVDKSRG
jgi:hypothetical protein